MAKKVQVFAHGAEPTRIHAHLSEHLANYAQYFSVEQRSATELALAVREVVARRNEFQKPGFIVRVAPAGTGSSVILYRILAPLGRYAIGIFIAASGIALSAAVALLLRNTAEWRSSAPFVAAAAGLTLAGLGLWELFYWLQRGRDRELTGILQKALADYGRPTAIRRAKASHQLPESMSRGEGP